VIVFDASSLVGAAIIRGGVPRRALDHAFATDTLALSDAVLAEVLDVLHRPRLQRYLDVALRAQLVAQLQAVGVRFKPCIRVSDCRDEDDNKYLELALAAGAAVIVTSDADLLALDPWRGVRILRPAEYLAAA
jgi:putative PIN family toxin of toxin-antitoxin system